MNETGATKLVLDNATQAATATLLIMKWLGDGYFNYATKEGDQYVLYLYKPLPQVQGLVICDIARRQRTLRSSDDGQAPNHSGSTI
jgi:hypothetical protein